MYKMMFVPLGPAIVSLKSQELWILQFDRYHLIFSTIEHQWKQLQSFSVAKAQPRYELRKNMKDDTSDDIEWADYVKLFL